MGAWKPSSDITHRVRDVDDLRRGARAVGNTDDVNTIRTMGERAVGGAVRSRGMDEVALLEGSHSRFRMSVRSGATRFHLHEHYLAPLRTHEIKLADRRARITINHTVPARRKVRCREVLTRISKLPTCMRHRENTEHLTMNM